MGLAVNKRELSEILGISERSLTDWQADGMPVAALRESVGQENTYDTEAVIRWWIQRDVARATGGMALDKLNEIRYQRECLSLKKDLGQIVDKEDIRPAFRQYVSDILATLLSIPDKYAQPLHIAQSLDEKHALLEGIVGEIRDELGNYEFCAGTSPGGNPGISHAAIGASSALG